MAQAVTDTQRILGQVSAMAMLDEPFQQRLAEGPGPSLRAFGITITDGIRVELVTDPALGGAATADDPTLRLYVPDAMDLTEEELMMAAGDIPSCSGTFSAICTVFTVSSTSTSSTWSCA